MGARTTVDLIQAELESRFPKLRSARYTITSPSDVRYNCIAWAAGDSRKFWWPHGFAFWPDTAPRENDLSAFEKAFASLGYERSSSHAHETGFEKVAIYAKPDGEPSHAARQLATGYWTSKLGKFVDIEHALEDLEGETYGRVTLVLRRGKPRNKSV